MLFIIVQNMFGTGNNKWNKDKKPSARESQTQLHNRIWWSWKKCRWCCIEAQQRTKQWQINLTGFLLLENIKKILLYKCLRIHEKWLLLKLRTHTHTYFIPANTASTKNCETHHLIEMWCDPISGTFSGKISLSCAIKADWVLRIAATTKYILSKRKAIRKLAMRKYFWEIFFCINWFVVPLPLLGLTSNEYQFRRIKQTLAFSIFMIEIKMYAV